MSPTPQVTPPTFFRHLLHRRAFELLRNGKWQPLEPVIRDLTRLVPPGIAMRHHEATRVNAAKQRGASGEPDPHRTRPAQERKESGARAVVRESLGTSAYELKNDKIRLVGVPTTVRGDRMRGQYLGPLLEGLAHTFLSHGLTWSWHQVQLAAHDVGLHLDTCPPGCELLPRNKVEVLAEPEDPEDP